MDNVRKHTSQESPDDVGKTIANIKSNMREHVAKQETHASLCNECKFETKLECILTDHVAKHRCQGSCDGNCK